LAPWCAPCRAIAPIIDDLAGDYSGRLKVVKMNVDDNPQTPGRYESAAFQFAHHQGGEVKNRIIGAVPKAPWSKRWTTRSPRNSKKKIHFPEAKQSGW